MKKHILLALLVTGLMAGPAFANPGDAEKGAQIYNKRCMWCHGEEGDGTGVEGNRLNPPPRAFSEGWYKIKSSAFDDDIVKDEDIFRMIKEGMPGTAMPGWSDILSDQDMWDLVVYLKALAGLEEEKATKDVDYGSEIKSSPESIAKGKELFIDRCAECHGDTGKGVSIKKLKDDLGYRTWPRNLTKLWTYRGSNSPKDIFTRITVGIPGTQMPSFADPGSNKKLSIEERWHVSNFVASLAETEKVVDGENIVIQVQKIEGALPDSPEDPKWAESVSTTLGLIPQFIADERLFTPSNDTITARAFYNDEEIAIFLEWDDRTKSIPGDVNAQNISDAEMGEDGVAIQFPVVIPDGMEKPYFGMGDAANPVNIWHWKSGTTESPETINLLNSKGFGEIEKRDASKTGLSAKGNYDKGTWRVVMKRPLNTDEAENDLQIKKGKFIPVAFAAWDGSNSEKGSKHTMTTWYWLFLKPAASANVYIVPIVVMLLIVGAELWWARSATKKN